MEVFISAEEDKDDYPFSREDCTDFIAVANELSIGGSDNWGRIACIGIGLVNTPEEVSIMRMALDKEHFHDHFIKFTFDLEPCPDKILLDHHIWGYANEVCRQIRLLIIASTIARPMGYFGSNDLIVIYDGRSAWSWRGDGMFGEYISYGMQLCDWPTYVRLPIRDTWEWASKRPGFLEKRSTDRVSRALSCYSQIFSEFNINEDYLVLLWSMMGLEALTNSGPSGLQSSFQSRICAMLGEPKKSKKLFKELYRERSKLIHGQYDLPGQFAKFPEDSDVSFYSDELYDAQSLALAILVGTLQYCAKNKISDFKFDIVVSEIFDK